MKLIFCLLVTLSVLSAAGQATPRGSLYCASNGRFYPDEASFIAGCEGGGVVAPPPGPTKEELDQKDLAEAADDFVDKGNKFYKEGAWGQAIAYYKKALDYNPDNDDATYNIKKAQEKIAAEQTADIQEARLLAQQKLAQERIEAVTAQQQQAEERIKAQQQYNQSAATPPVNTDPSVVDTRNISTGLPKEVEDSIPHTPAGDRVRKGFEAIQAHDWKVALAWFQDALNHEPSDPGLQRLVDLAKYTLQMESQPAASKPVSQGVDLIKQSLGNYQDYVARHPELGNNLSDWQFLNTDTEDPAWMTFLKVISSWVPISEKVDPSIKPRSESLGVRG